MKRFTDTDKWRDSWFRALNPNHKLAILYLYDNCDPAGVFDPDFALADFVIGTPIDWAGLLGAAGDRIALLKDGKWHLTRFVEFQQGKLNPACRPHASIIRLLEGYGIKRVSKQYPKGHSIVESSKVESSLVIYAEYPKKTGKEDALKAIQKALATHPAEKLLEATKAYAAATALWPEADRKFIPHPATWFNRGSYEDDPATWTRNGRAQLDPKYNTF